MKTETERPKITRNEFAMACGERLIPIEIALENEAVVEAVKTRDIEKVKKALDENF